MGEDDRATLIGLIYEGASTPGKWQQALHRLVSCISASAAAVIIWDRRLQRATLGDQVGFAPGLGHSYAEQLVVTSPGLAQLERLRVGEWLLRRGGKEQWRANANSIGLDSVVSPLCRDDRLEVFLVIAYRAQDALQASIAASMMKLVPHMQRACCMRQEHAALLRRFDLSSRLLDRLHFPVLAVAGDRRVLLANRAGTEWLRQPRNPISQATRETSQVAALIRQVCSAGRPAGLRLRKATGDAYSLIAAPLPPNASDTHADAWPAVLVVFETDRPHGAAADVLRQMFQLTPAELRLLEQLLTGCSLKQCASILAISNETARSQLKSIFDKLGVHRQSDLLRVLGWVGRLDMTAASSSPH